MKNQVITTVEKMRFIAQSGCETQKKELLTLMRYLLATSIGALSSAFFVATKTDFVLVSISLIGVGFLFILATAFLFVHIISVIYSINAACDEGDL